MRRKSPFNEGSLKIIYERFFAPLVRYKPHLTSLKQWFELLFHINTREIEIYRAKAPLLIPGLLHEAANVKVQGRGIRAVKRGALLFVRTDASTPEVVEVEFTNVRTGPSSKVDPGTHHWFSMTKYEWYSIAPKLKRISDDEV